MSWQGSEYGNVLNIWTEFWISYVLNMPGLWDRIWQGSEYARVTQGSEYAIIWLNMSAYDVNMPEYVWIYDNRHGSEHVSCSI